MLVIMFLLNISPLKTLHFSSYPIKLDYTKPVCQQSGWQIPLLRRTRRFFPSGGQNNRHYSFIAPTYLLARRSWPAG